MSSPVCEFYVGRYVNFSPLHLTKGLLKLKPYLKKKIHKNLKWMQEKMLTFFDQQNVSQDIQEAIV